MKGRCLELLGGMVERQRADLLEIDYRLGEYFDGLVRDSSCEEGDAGDLHSLSELLCGLKLLRLMRTYEVDVEKVRQVIRLREGVWKRDGRIWVWESGGLLLPGPRGQTHYRWEPFQVMILAAMYGPRAWIDTRRENGTRVLLASEREGAGGTIEDNRRLCTDFTFFAPRKTDKTGLSSYNNFLFFMLEDADSEIYCCANSQNQSKLLYDRTQQLIRQMDPQGRRVRYTATTTNWKPYQARSSQLWALSAGGKTKDGLFAQLCCADEYGSAGYTNGKSDMGMLVNVIQSSMGPRREPMTFTSTTAGQIQAGPFMDRLEGMKGLLRKELAYAEGKEEPQKADDRWMALLLEPDVWELDDEYLYEHRNVWKKVNPMLGIICQESYYEESIASSRLDPGKRAEVLTKNFNIWQSQQVEEWITPEEVRKIQTGHRVDECTVERGWDVYVGMDFSLGNDLHAVTYLCENEDRELFADMDAWITEDALVKSPVRGMLERWVEDGWLRVSPGKTLQTTLPIDRIVELDGKGVNFLAFGYDSYNSREPVNALSEWLVGLGVDPKQIVIPVRQNFATYNPAVVRLDKAVKSDPPLIWFSKNPMWPWEFGNVVLAVSQDGMENRKPLKAHRGSAACKVDNVQCLCTCIILEEMLEGKIY